ncbi:MAG: DUF4159 domain-containing protein [Chthoniobacterales bacterium]
MKDKLSLFVRRFSRSRDFTISFIIHLIVIALFGTAMLVPPLIRESPPISTDFLAKVDGIPEPPPPTGEENISDPDPSQMEVPSAVAPPITTITPRPDGVKAFEPAVVGRMTSNPEVAGKPVEREIKSITIPTRQISELVKKSRSASSEGKFSFTVFVGQYSGGNWSSTAQVEEGYVTRGSLPNLLYYLDKVSGSRIQGNEQKVRVISLGSSELLTVMPPFIFITGTRDFTLTDKEVENLRKYLQIGGAIWGDSSVPGQRSRFDIAFRREMRRVIPDKDKDFEPLAKSHPLFTKGYFPEIRGVVPGLNHYDEPVYAMKLYGQVAILYTANDYADMWQVGLYSDPKTHKPVIDRRLSAQGGYVAINPDILNYEGTYLHNLSVQSLENSYKFGANIVVHFLTRWDEVVGRKTL